MDDAPRRMLDLARPEPIIACPRCNGGRTWVQPPSTSDIAHGGVATLFHCCGDGKKLTARIVERSEDDVVAKWNSGAFDWVKW